MADYKKLFTELRYEVWKVSFLEAFLNAALAFFISNIVFTIIKQRYLYSLIPALIVFVWNFIIKTRKYTLKKIEEGNPEVSEILRTAHDNKNKDELLVHALFLELIQKMETVTAGVFINPRKTVVKLFVIAILAFVPVMITSFASFLIIDNPFAGFSVQSILPRQWDTLAPMGPIDEAGERDIYGEKDIIQLGSEKLDITASSGQGGVDFTKTEEATGRGFRYNDYPIEPEAEQTEAGSSTTTDSALINDYSCKTKKTC